MAREQETKDLLAGRKKAQGWRDQLGGDQAEEPQDSEPTLSPKKKKSKYKRKTYLMTDDLISRIETQAEKAGVGINEMNRYLLTVALDMVEQGELEVEVQMVNKRTLGV